MNLYEILHNNLFSFLKSELCANLIQFIILFFTCRAVIIAKNTLKLDIQQRKLSNTLEYIHLFLNGCWVSNEDKFNWNLFYKNKLIRNACGDFCLTGEYKSNGNNLPIINIFSEGYDEKYGRSITNILNVLEYIAIKINKKELDLDLIKINLLRFYLLAGFYIEILEKETNQILYPNAKQLYELLIKTYKTNEPYGNYCEFPLEINRK